MQSSRFSGQTTSTVDIHISGRSAQIARNFACISRGGYPFLIVKGQFGYTKVRYRGLVKNTAQLTTLFALANLWLVRRKPRGLGV